MNVIAAATSASAPLPGQSHRSGPNFQLIANDGGSITLTVTGNPGIVFDVKQDVFGTDPTPIESATSGRTVPGNTLEVGKNYYIANPKGASGNFSVTFSQD